MHRLLWCALLALSLQAQDPSELFHQPPPDVDRALRARVSEFFDLHVKGQFRRVEPLVAEDSKDLFYNGNKPQYLSFEIGKITYDKDFTHAQVIVYCEQRVAFPGFEGKPLKLPVLSFWKIEAGKWCWYIDQTQLRRTPFGTMMAPGGGSVATTAAPPLAAIPSTDQFYALFKADKNAVILEPGSSAQVVVSNDSPGSMTVGLLGSLAGIDAKFDHTDVKSGEKAVLTLHAGPKPQAGNLQIRIDPIGKLLPLQVSVK